MNRSIQVAAALTVGLYSTYHTLSYIKEDCEKQHLRQQQNKFEDIMKKNNETLTSIAKKAEKLNIK
jgi:hypothetical protein